MTRRPESAEWNRPYLKLERCIRVAPDLDADPPILFADGDPVGDGYVMPRDPRWDPDTTARSACVDKPGSVRIDMSETVSVDGATLYFHKGGQGYEPKTVPYGHVDGRVLRNVGPPAFSKQELDAHGAKRRNRRGHGPGRAAPLSDVSYRVHPRPIGPPPESPRAWFYKDKSHYPDENLSGAKLAKYGEAGPTQGGKDRSFAYLCWSWVRQHGESGHPRHEVSGGGAVRALLRPGQEVRRCDVPAITSPAWDSEGKVVGEVVVVYVQLPVAELYGWTVHSHTPRGGERVLHVERA